MRSLGRHALSGLGTGIGAAPRRPFMHDCSTACNGRLRGCGSYLLWCAARSMKGVVPDRLIEEVQMRPLQPAAARARRAPGGARATGGPWAPRCRARWGRCWASAPQAPRTRRRMCAGLRLSMTLQAAQLHEL